MKWLLLIFGAILTLVVLTFGGGLAYLMNVRTDVSKPELAAAFQKGMEADCFRQAKANIRHAGAALDYQQEALVKQVCACDMKAVTKLLAKKGAKTVFELSKAYNESTQELQVAFNSCADAYGLE
jgi:hypothetical protein